MPTDLKTYSIYFKCLKENIDLDSIRVSASQILGLKGDDLKYVLIPGNIIKIGINKDPAHDLWNKLNNLGVHCKIKTDEKGLSLIPDNMIPIEELSTLLGVDEQEAIHIIKNRTQEMIGDRNYEGWIIGGKWYINFSRFKPAQSSNNNSQDQTANTNTRPETRAQETESATEASSIVPPRTDIPATLMPVKEFALKKDIEERVAIIMLRNGEYNGRQIDGEWYAKIVQTSKQPHASVSSGNKGSLSIHQTASGLVILPPIVAAISFLFGANFIGAVFVVISFVIFVMIDVDQSWELAKSILWAIFLILCLKVLWTIEDARAREIVSADFSTPYAHQYTYTSINH